MTKKPVKIKAWALWDAQYQEIVAVNIIKSHFSLSGKSIRKRFKIIPILITPLK